MSQQSSYLKLKSQVPYADIIHGKTHTVRYQRNVPCDICLSKTKSERENTNCAKCTDSGLVKEDESVTVKFIPRHRATDVIMKYDEDTKGNYTSLLGSEGGVYVSLVPYDPSSTFTSKGKDLHCEVEISSLQSKFGGVVDVPSVESKKIPMRIKAGTKDGDRITLRGYGGYTFGEADRGNIVACIKVRSNATEEVAIEAINALHKKERSLVANVEALQQEVEEQKGKVEKETRIRSKKAVRTTIEKIVSDLMPSIDSLEKALESMEALNDTSHQEGLQLILDMQYKVLKQYGVEVISPLGMAFDPHFHDAVTVDYESTMKKNYVSAVLQKGYTCNGRLIRAAKVVVRK